MESKFDSQSYARLTDLPKGLTQHYLTKPPHERVQHPTFTAWAFSRSLLKIRFNLHAKNDSSLNHGIISLSSIHTALRASLLRPIHTTETLNYSFLVWQISLTALPKSSNPPLTHLTNPPNQKGAGGGSALPLQFGMEIHRIST